jgi:hypothetical protein
MGKRSSLFGAGVILSSGHGKMDFKENPMIGFHVENKSTSQNGEGDQGGNGVGCS